MCGIAGILVRDDQGHQPDEERRMRAALERLRHRGPDDQGQWQSSGLVLGHRRLSILDLSPAGHQPMHTGDGRYVCSLNGEIYNYLELRAELTASGHSFRTGTDTEVLLAAFAQWGSACLERLRGQFAFAIWDTTARRLFLARDRVGEKPLHYWRDRDRFVFASEMKGLLELIPATPPLSPDAVNGYLHYQYVVEPHTLLDGVVKLPAGHVLEVDAGDWHARPRPYWSLASVPPERGEPVSRLRDALEEAVELTLRSDAPVGLSLSGGLDSSVVAALAARRRRDLIAFTVGYPGGRSFDERSQARELAVHLGMSWYDDEIATGDFVAFFPRLVHLLDEPIADTAAYAQFRVSRLAAEHGVKVLLTGIGGDELFFGYGWVREALRLSRLKLALRSHASPWIRAHSRVLRVLALRTPAHKLAVNWRLPGWWRAMADRAFDRGKVDLDHADEWVFYQLDYHWRPAVEFAPRVLAPGFQARIAPRSAYRFMKGLGSGEELEVAISSMLFDSWLVSNCLALGDRVSMASSVEARVPLLDAAVVEATAGFWKAGRSEDALGHKTWLREIARDLLPAHVCDRPKLGFVTPTVEWTQAVNAKYRAHLLDGALVGGRVLDPDRLRDWMQHTPRGIHRDFFQYKLTLLEIWCRVVLHGERPETISPSSD